MQWATVQYQTTITVWYAVEDTLLSLSGMQITNQSLKDRDKLSLFEGFSPYDGEKESRGYSFSHLITMGKKTVGYIFKFPLY